MKPYTNDGVNWYLPGGLVFRTVSTNEILEKDDLVRDLYESPMMSQDGGWDLTYKKDKWRGTQWHKVKDDLTAWVGRTIDEYNDFSNKNSHYGPSKFEIIRIIL